MAGGNCGHRFDNSGKFQKRARLATFVTPSLSDLEPFLWGHDGEGFLVLPERCGRFGLLGDGKRRTARVIDDPTPARFSPIARARVV